MRQKKLKSVQKKKLKKRNNMFFRLGANQVESTETCAPQQMRGNNALASCYKFLLKPLILLTLIILPACKKDEDYDVKNAVSAFASIDPTRLDPTLSKSVVTIPPQKTNNAWTNSASAKNQQIENFSKNFSFKKSQKISLKKSSQFWSFYSGDIVDRFVFSPIIKDNKIFTLDTSGELMAYDLIAEKNIWKSQIFKKKILKNYRAPKIGYLNGKIFAVAGTNKVVAASEIDGKVLWSRDISSIPVSAPVAEKNMVYVATNDNKIYAFDTETGELQWLQSGILRNTAIFGAADPVIYKDTLIVSYSSGEIYALNKKTGEALWSQNLNLSRATNSDFYLNDIDATPTVKDDVVYAIGNGGVMMAVNVKNGNYLWKKELAGIVDFWLAGDFLFVINNDNKLLAMSKKTGGIKWISQLPNFVKEKKPETKIAYNGVVMAGDKLLISSARGELLIASPLDGTIEKTLSTGKKISHAPVVVGNKIYFYALGKYWADLLEVE